MVQDQAALALLKVPTRVTLGIKGHSGIGTDKEGGRISRRLMPNDFFINRTIAKLFWLSSHCIINNVHYYVVVDPIAEWCVSVPVCVHMAPLLDPGTP